MRNLLGTCSLLLGTVAFAQAPATVELVPIARSTAACPVGFTASRLTGEQQLRTRSPRDRAAEASALGFHLTFFTPDAAAQQGIVEAKLTFHGLLAPALLPAVDRSRPAPDPHGTESLSVHPKPGPSDVFRSTAFTHRLTGVQQVELTAITYTDGSSWHEPAPGTCLIAPSPFLPVALAAR